MSKFISNKPLFKYVLFFNWKMKQNKFVYLLFSIFSLLFWLFLSFGLILELNVKPYVLKNYIELKTVDFPFWFVEIFPIVLFALSSFFFILLFIYAWKSKKVFGKNNLYLEGLSLHFETQLIQKEFLIKNNLWLEFEDFQEKKGLKISKFDYIYNGSALLSLLRKIKLTSYVSIKKYSLKEIDVFANDFRLRDYKINYLEDIKSLYKKLLIMTFVNSFLLINICVFGSMTLLQAILDLGVFDYIALEMDVPISSYLNTELFLATLILFVIFLSFFWTFSFTYFKNYLISYYKVFTVALYNFEKVDNFEENEDFKNSVYACFIEKEVF